MIFLDRQGEKAIASIPRELSDSLFLDRQGDIYTEMCICSYIHI